MFAPDYEHRFYDDADAVAFLREQFISAVPEAFKNFTLGAHKADLLRYAVLYIHGGVYLDIKTQLVRPLDELVQHGDAITTVISRKPSEMYQGIIAAPPRAPIFLALIDAAVRSGSTPPYNRFIRDFMQYVRTDVAPAAVAADTLLRGQRHSYQLFTERCDRDAARCEDGLDRYKQCCTVEAAGARVFKTRYADFPW